MEPTRPLLRYHGGKWLLAPWVISFFPKHKVYVEPFAGAASILLRKERVAAECLNDLDSRIVGLFRLLRDPVKARELQRRLELTPYAREEFMASYEPADDEIDVARKLIVLSFMGHGSDSIGRGYRTGFRCKSSDSRALPSQDWAGWPKEIPAFVARLRGVAIENRDAVEIIERLDSPGTLFYVDPPYPKHTRSSSAGKHGYRHELDDDGHRRLAQCLHAVDGMVVLSGYHCDLYDIDLYTDWQRHERAHLADGALPRTEVVWLNQACAAALDRQRAQGKLLLIDHHAQPHSP